MRFARLFFLTVAISLVPFGLTTADTPETAPQPTAAEAEQLITDGDRLADQADYSGALQRYTEAYHAIVSGIRGQQFTTRVLPNLLTREQLGEEMLRMMKEEYTAEELALMDASFKVFGLMPPEINSQELMAKLLTEEVAGFYDPDKKRMVLIREKGSAKEPGFLGRLLGIKPAFDKAEQKTTLAHEMTHALQDQLYDLKAMQKRVEKDDDLSLAFSALVEGDATLLMFAEMDEGTDITEMEPEVIRATFSMMSWMVPLAGGATLRKAPPIFRESLIFPYFQGMVFCISVTGKRGWPALHAAYADPPASTEQILHPKKYTAAERDDPQLVVIPDLKNATLPATWKHLGGNCLGEFQTSILLKRLRSAARASAGWDGDRYEVFQHTDGQLGLVFVSVWDSQQDAEEFAAAYKEYREPPKKVRGTETPNDQPQGTTQDGTPASAVTERSIERQGDKVWIVEGFSPDETKRIAAQLPNSRFETKHFPAAK